MGGVREFGRLGDVKEEREEGGLKGNGSNYDLTIGEGSGGLQMTANKRVSGVIGNTHSLLNADSCNTSQTMHRELRLGKDRAEGRR